MLHAISNILSYHFDKPYIITEKKALPGGEIHKTRLISNGETEVFIKYNNREMLPIFVAEADQLKSLARSNTVRVPEVFGVGNTRDFSFLLLEYLPHKKLDAHSAYCLGQQLARLHQWSDQPNYGFDFDNDLATVPQPNVWQKRWCSFFAEQRIGWQLQLAAEKNIFYGEMDEIVDAVSQRLKNHQPQPSLLHGDLWPANCGLAPMGPVLFDPACYWGDRECELAMLPYYPELPTQLYDGYQSVWPLPASFVERQPVYQLYYLLNRAYLFGAPHRQIVQQLVDRLLKGQ